METQTVEILQTWLDALKAAARTFMQTTYNVENVAPTSRLISLPWNHTQGAWIPIIGESYSLQLGVVSTDDGCQAIARNLLCMAPEAPLTEEDMADAFRETINILVGISKTAIEGDISCSTLGLPIFITGQIKITKEQAAISEMITLGGVGCYLIVLKQR
jgi:chemotaxis protein CheY-P-specific phosphatase CheC